MLKSALKNIEEKLRDSQLKGILAEELTGLLKIKPADVRTDEYIGAMANIIIHELSSQLNLPDQTLVDIFPPPSDRYEFNCTQVINGLVKAMSHDLDESNLQMVKALGDAIAERDCGTNEHNYRVTIYAVSLAEHLNLPVDRIRALGKGSFLHDIGKIGIRDGTLLKKGHLTPDEYEIVKKHVLYGARIINHVRWLEDAMDVVLYHHERWNGSGYLKGLKGEQIPLNARIFAIADVFDSLTSERPYKNPFPRADAFKIIVSGKDNLFDPDLVDSFMEIAEDVAEKVLSRSHKDLEDVLLLMIYKYFNISPHSKTFKPSKELIDFEKLD